MPYIRVRKIARKGVVQAIVERLSGKILAGDLAPGESLPPERELAPAFGVNRLTLRQALARLEALGLVKAIHGTGTRVLDFRRTAGLGLLSDLMTARREEAQFPIDLLRDLLEVRRIIAVEMVALALERRTVENLHDLRRIIEEQEGRQGDLAAFVRGDIEFGRCLVRSCRNVAMELLFNAVATFLETHEDVARAMFAQPSEVLRHYRAVLAMLEAGRAGEVRGLVRTVLEGLDRSTMNRFEALRASSSARD